MLFLKIFYEYFYKNKIEKKNKYECDQEWEILTDKCYFRKNIAYYYTDLKKIRLGLIRHADFQNKFQLSIQVIVNEQKNNFNISDVTVRKGYSVPRPYSFEYIEAYFDDLNIDKNTRINVKVFNKKYSTKESIELVIKKYNENDNVKKHSMFCGRISYSTDYIKYLDYWIKMIKISGYDLIALFNHTYSSDFNKIYSKAVYKNNIVLNQFNCLPNLSINNSNHFINFNDIKKIFTNKYLSQYLVTLFFQIFSLNECYLMYKDKYKYIGVFDFDEIILPRVAYNNSKINESFYINFDQYPDKIDPISNKASKLIPYLDSLEFISKLEKKVNIRFEMSNYLKHETVHKIFLQLENMFKLNLTRYKINQDKIIELDGRYSKEKIFHLNSYITIETEQDYKYAKHLYEMHKKYVEPFLEKNHNEIEKLVPKIFNRFYYFTSFVGVDFLPMPKTIHYTNQTDLVDIHVPFNIETNDSIILSTEYGHLSHFREIYKRSFTNSSIQRIFFDFNYFNNYFKASLKKNKLIYNYI
jgi:hypothetical protein